MLMIVGIGFLLILTAPFASTFVSADQQREERASGQILEMLRRLEERLERLEARS